MKYQALYEFIPFLEEAIGNKEKISRYVSSETFDGIYSGSMTLEYRDELQDLIRLFHQPEYYVPKYNEVLNNYFGDVDMDKLPPEKVEKAPSEVLLAILSKSIDRERFHEGYFGERVEDGRMLNILKFLKAQDK